MPGDPFEFPSNKFVENPGGWSILVSAFDQFGVDVFLKHLASAQLFILGLALSHKCVKNGVRVDALLLATFLVGNEMSGV